MPFLPSSLSVLLPYYCPVSFPKHPLTSKADQPFFFFSLFKGKCKKMPLYISLGMGVMIPVYYTLVWINIIILESIYTSKGCYMNHNCQRRSNINPALWWSQQKKQLVIALQDIYQVSTLYTHSPTSHTKRLWVFHPWTFSIIIAQLCL